MLSFLNIVERMSALENAGFPNGTYDIRTFDTVTYSAGYQVTFCQVGDNYGENEFMWLVARFVALSDDAGISAGVYGNAEISFHIADNGVAVALAHAYNQISVWDWANGCEILTGGTGTRN